MTIRPALIGLAPAETGLRAYAFDSVGEIIDRRLIAGASISAGMADWLSPGVTVIAAGAGGALLPLPVALEDVAGRLAAHDGRWHVPGFKQENPPGILQAEVAALVGLEESMGRVCMPGALTHHVRIEFGKVVQIAAEMTLELRDMLLRAGTLCLPEGARQTDAPEVFANWVEHGLESGMRGALHTVRAARHINQLAPEHHVVALTGLMIGADVAAHYDPGDEVFLVADGPLAEAYGRAFDALGVEVDQLSAETCMTDGLFEIADAAGKVG
jgi:2-dehydro-3-deoxygalactonokinase